MAESSIIYPSVNAALWMQVDRRWAGSDQMAWGPQRCGSLVARRTPPQPRLPLPPLVVATGPVFSIVTGEPFKQSAELTGEPIEMKA